MTSEEEIGRTPLDVLLPPPRSQTQDSATGPPAYADINAIVFSLAGDNSAPALSNSSTEQRGENSNSSPPSYTPRAIPESHPILPYEFTVKYSTINSGENFRGDLDHDYRLIFPVPIPWHVSAPSTGSTRCAGYLARYRAHNGMIELYGGPTPSYPVIIRARFFYSEKISHLPAVEFENNDKNNEDDPKVSLPARAKSHGFNRYDPFFLTSTVKGKAETKKYMIKNTAGHEIRSLGWVSNELSCKGTKIMCLRFSEIVAVYFENHLTGTGKMRFLGSGRISGDQFMLAAVMKFLMRLESNRRRILGDEYS